MGGQKSLEVKTVKAQESTSNYGLRSNIQDGTILHCFAWTFEDIKKELPNIAASGFSSVQTSPVQPSLAGGCGTTWYLPYSQSDFSVWDTPLGNKEDLKNLCDEAEKYGIKVIVDVVANHSSNYFMGYDNYHNYGNISYSSRKGIVLGDMSGHDLASEKEPVYSAVKNYVKELKEVGVDGIRWDAAKHIQLPSESFSGIDKCQFWPNVTSVNGMYSYGEVIYGPNENGTGDSTNVKLMKEYASYMSVTDSVYSADILRAMKEGKLATQSGYWADAGVAAKKLLYWAESHDVYCDSNSNIYTAGISQNKIDRTYAVVASRANATSLYFSRPSAIGKENINLAVKGSTHFTSPEVAEVNKLHNAKVGESDYYAVDKTANVCAVFRKTGITVVKGSGSGKIS